MMDGSANPNAAAAAQLMTAYRNLSEQVYAQLMAQTHLSALYELVSYSWDGATQSLVGHLSAVRAQLEAELASNSDSRFVRVAEFIRTVRGLGAAETMNLGSLSANSFFTPLVSASVGAVWIAGGAANDVLAAASGNSIVLGGAGSDTIESRPSIDVRMNCVRHLRARAWTASLSQMKALAKGSLARLAAISSCVILAAMLHVPQVYSEELRPIVELDHLKVCKTQRIKTPENSIEVGGFLFRSRRLKQTTVDTCFVGFRTKDNQLNYVDSARLDRAEFDIADVLSISNDIDTRYLIVSGSAGASGGNIKTFLFCRSGRNVSLCDVIGSAYPGGIQIELTPKRRNSGHLEVLRDLNGDGTIDIEFWAFASGIDRAPNFTLLFSIVDNRLRFNRDPKFYRGLLNAKGQSRRPLSRQEERIYGVLAGESESSASVSKPKVSVDRELEKLLKSVAEWDEAFHGDASYAVLRTVRLDQR